MRRPPYPALRLGVLACATAVVGCASPSPDYAGITPERRVIDGTDIHVWQRGDRAQAIRTGWVARSDHRDVMARMVQATEAVTGCAVRHEFTEGDSGVLNMRLAC